MNSQKLPYVKLASFTNDDANSPKIKELTLLYVLLRVLVAVAILEVVSRAVEPDAVSLGAAEALLLAAFTSKAL